MNGERKPAKECRVALYARVSSDKQAQEGTIDSQVSLIRQRIEANGHVLEPELCFVDDGVSGSTLVRPALERVRDQAAAGAIDQLYLLAPDRLARRHAHQMVLVEELQGCGVTLVFVNRPLGSTPEDELLLQVQGIIGEYERAKILERTRRGRLHAARCNRLTVLSQIPFGYRYIDKKTGGGVASHQVIEEQAHWVRQMFLWVGREGCSLSEVTRRLQQQGVLTPRGRRRWYESTVGRILRNSAYRGQAFYNKTARGPWRPPLRPPRGAPPVPKQPCTRQRQPLEAQIPMTVPALVDGALFTAVQERLEENRRRLRLRRTGARFLLQGLTVCACCGYAIYSQANGKRAYYRCIGRDAARFAGLPICQNPTQRVADLEATVWNDVCALLSEPDRRRQEFERRQQTPALGETTAENDRLQAVIAKTKQSISRLIDAYEAGLLEATEFEPRIRRLKERLVKSEAELQMLTEQLRQHEDLRLVFSQFEEFADQMKAGLQTTTWSQRREILRALVKRVEVDKDKIHIVYKVSAHPFAKGPNGGQVQRCSVRLAGNFSSQNPLLSLVLRREN